MKYVKSQYMYGRKLCFVLSLYNVSGTHGLAEVLERLSSDRSKIVSGKRTAGILAAPSEWSDKDVKELCLERPSGSGIVVRAQGATALCFLPSWYRVQRMPLGALLLPLRPHVL